MTVSFSDFGQNSGFVADLYKLFLQDPNYVSKDWQNYFSKHSTQLAIPYTTSAPSTLESNTYSTKLSEQNTRQAEPQNILLNYKAFQLINAYRNFGHLKAKINPLSKGVEPLNVPGDLNPEFYGISGEDTEIDLFVDNCCGLNKANLTELVEALEKIYCKSVGFEYTHLTNFEERDWLREKIESGYFKTEDNKTETQKYISRAKDLVAATGLEAEIHKKYVGAKRFSLEGGEVLIPMLKTIIDLKNVKEAVIGMAHRGRLNVLANIVGKPYSEIFKEFEDKTLQSLEGNGDVKYHNGWSSNLKKTNGEEIKVSLAYNPSHLEFVNPVVAGMAKALQYRDYTENPTALLPILIHGDAAFVGQGIVPEILNLAKVPGYTNFGSMHIVINNQVGFTTNAVAGRSSNYCTDFAKGYEVPVFHVNAEDVDACCRVVELANEFREKFERDVIIDLYCYRKYGHNEGDDPTYTQPLMYQEVKQKAPISQAYLDGLIQKHLLNLEQKNLILKEFKDKFEAEYKIATDFKVTSVTNQSAVKKISRDKTNLVKTNVSEEKLFQTIKSLTDFPANFTVHPKLAAQLAKRVDSVVKEGNGIEWGTAEALAYGSLLLEGTKIRISGEDCGRGTFSHRHLELLDYEKKGAFYPLKTLINDKSSSFEIFNSPLSEAAVLGFEYGFSNIVSNKSLTIWEAQFGDFGNGAQVIIDQFLASGEAKWKITSGLVMLLPHGYEGQGPEHSSARLERYLQLCAEDNIIVANPTASAQVFHLLRRQALTPSDNRKPLIVMTPKSLLRLPEASSVLNDFTKGSFNKVISTVVGKKSKKVILCSGKVYYDIVKHAQGNKLDATIIRLEQLYPFPKSEVLENLKILKTKEIIWAQEEPQNMGAFRFVESQLHSEGINVQYVGRKESASPATGSPGYHAKELKEFLAKL